MTSKEKAKKLHEITDALEEWGKYNEKVTNVAEWGTPAAKQIIRKAMTLLVNNLVLLNECKNKYGCHSPLLQCFMVIEQVASLPETKDLGDCRGWIRDFTERHLWGGVKRSLADECIRYANKVTSETEKGNKDTKSEGEGGFIDNTKPTIKKLLSKNFIKATIKHFPYCGSYLFDVIYGVDGMKEQKEKTNHSIIPKDNIDGTTPKPKKEKSRWGRKIIASLGVIVAILIFLFGDNIWGRFNEKLKSKKTTTETTRMEPNQIAETKLDLSLRNICQDIDSSPLAHQNETAMRYIGVPLKEQELELFDIYSEDDKFGLNMIIPGQPDVTFLKGIRIYFSVDKNQYPELNAATKGVKFYVTGKIKEADRFMIKLSNVSLKFD